MKIFVENSERNNIRDKELLELSIIGKLDNGEKIEEEKLEEFSKKIKKVGIKFSYYIEETSGYAWCKISVGDNPKNAGRKHNQKANQYTDIDILILLCDFSNKHIIELMGIHEATYYRAKKKMKDRKLYKIIEKEGNLRNKSALSKEKDKYIDNQGNIYIAEKFL